LPLLIKKNFPLDASRSLSRQFVALFHRSLVSFNFLLLFHVPLLPPENEGADNSMRLSTMCHVITKQKREKPTSGGKGEKFFRLQLFSFLRVSAHHIGKEALKRLAQSTRRE
jgi:hypothetical protein